MLHSNCLTLIWRCLMRSHTLTSSIKYATANARLRIGDPAVLLALLSLFPARSQNMNKRAFAQTGMDEQCVSNLRHIHKLLKVYLHQSAGVLGFPSNLESVYGMSKDS